MKCRRLKSSSRVLLRVRSSRIAQIQTRTVFVGGVEETFAETTEKTFETAGTATTMFSHTVTMSRYNVNESCHFTWCYVRVGPITSVTERN